jgi:ATP-dependent 26S proteasome regulatory subunit
MVRDAFELAKEKAKGRGGAIIFIDEVRVQYCASSTFLSQRHRGLARADRRNWHEAIR